MFGNVLVLIIVYVTSNFTKKKQELISGNQQGSIKSKKVISVQNGLRTDM